MFLPGIQALFGFQLIAVLSAGFGSLPASLRRLHFASTILTTISIALVLAPAAFHRHPSPQAVSEELLRIATRLLVASMWPLAIGICLELDLVGVVVVGEPWIAAISAGVFVLFLTFWLVLPRRHRRRMERELG